MSLSEMDALIDRAARGVLGPEEGPALRAMWQDVRTICRMFAELHRSAEADLAAREDV